MERKKNTSEYQLTVDNLVHVNLLKYAGRILNIYGNKHSWKINA